MAVAQRGPMNNVCPSFCQEVILEISLPQEISFRTKFPKCF